MSWFGTLSESGVRRAPLRDLEVGDGAARTSRPTTDPSRRSSSSRSRCCPRHRCPGQTPPVAAVVVDVMCTVNVLAACVVPAGTVTGPQFSVPAVIAHVPPQPAPWLAIATTRPAFVGSGSLRVDALRVTRAGVVDGQREADRIARVHLRRVRRLHDLDRRARRRTSTRSTDPSRRSSSSP